MQVKGKRIETDIFVEVNPDSALAAVAETAWKNLIGAQPPGKYIDEEGHWSRWEHGGGTSIHPVQYRTATAEEIKLQQSLDFVEACLQGRRRDIEKLAAAFEKT